MFSKWWNGEMVQWWINLFGGKWWNCEMVIWYDDFNMSIWFRGSEFFPPGHLLWDISRGNFPGRFVAQDKSRDTNCPVRWTGIGCYLCTYDDIYLIILYVKGCIRYGVFIYIRLSTYQDIVLLCPGRDWFRLKPLNFEVQTWPLLPSLLGHRNLSLMRRKTWRAKNSWPF